MSVEHHATTLIDAVVFVLDTSEYHCPTRIPFSGKLSVDGVSFYAGMHESDFPEEVASDSNDTCQEGTACVWGRMTSLSQALAKAWRLAGEVARNISLT